MGEPRVIAGRYLLEEPVGLGGMSSVWRARDLDLERLVAVKILGRDSDRQRFEREARAAAALAHPNVCRLWDFGESEEGPFIVLELLPGGTLEERFAEARPLPDAETERIAREIAAGLAAAHEHGLVHRDLKPANVIFDGEGRAKLADFGIARMGEAGTITEAGTVMGTAAYISPEQAEGRRAGPESDVYSFGVILYRMLTGRLPFEAEEPMALLASHVTQEPPPVEDVRADAPAALAAVAAAALRKDPGERPADGTALLADLEGGAPATAARTAVLTPGARPSSGHRPGRRAAVAAGALVLAAAGGGVALLATGGTRPAPSAPPATLPPGTEDEGAPASPAPAIAPTGAETETDAETATQTTAPATTAATQPAGTDEPEPLPTVTVPPELPTTVPTLP